MLANHRQKEIFGKEKPLVSMLENSINSFGDPSLINPYIPFLQCPIELFTNEQDVNQMDKYEKHVNDILEAIGKDDVDRSEIEKELKNYVEEFRLTVGEAKKLIARKHGANIAVSSEGMEKLIKELNSLD